MSIYSQLSSSTGGGGTGGLGLTWTDTSGTVSATANNGYFTTGATTSTLPASPTEGTAVAYIVDNASSVTIKGNTGQKIRIGASISAAAGTCVSSVVGNSVTLIYRTADTTWIAQSSIGTWTIT